MGKKESESFLEMPYGERQLIIVVDDHVVEEERNAKASIEGDESEIDWIEVGKRTIQLAKLASPTTVLIIEGVTEVIKAVNRLRNAGMTVLSVSKSESKTLCLPPGHPRDGVLYVGHPAVPHIYYTTAQFHRLTFEHKFCEAIDLLMALGATEINVEHEIGWEKEFSANLSGVPIGTAGEQVGVTANVGTEKHRQLLFEASLSETVGPSVPDGLVWYPHEPTWRQIAKSRIEYGMRDFSLNVRYDDDFGVNADLKLSVEKEGLDLGGDFEGHEMTIWKVRGSFKPPERER